MWFILRSAAYFSTFADLQNHNIRLYPTNTIFIMNFGWNRIKTEGRKSSILKILILEICSKCTNWPKIELALHIGSHINFNQIGPIVINITWQTVAKTSPHHPQYDLSSILTKLKLTWRNGRKVHAHVASYKIWTGCMQWYLRNRT